jgi:hypothetical protein
MLGVTKVTIVGNQRLLLFGYPNTRNFLFGKQSRSEYANCGSLCSPSSTLVATSAFARFVESERISLEPNVCSFSTRANHE